MCILKQRIPLYLAQGRLSHAICEVSYDELTPEVLIDTSKSNNNNDCLDAIKSKLTNPVFEGYTAAKNAQLKEDDNFVSSNKNAIESQIQADCQNSCIFSNASDETNCKIVLCKL